MDVANAVILGVLQGLTEFLPISSSGHLVIAQHYISGTTDEVFILCVHLATLAAVCITFRHDIRHIIEPLYRRKAPRPVLGIRELAIGSIPAALAGVMLEETFDAAFSSLPAVTGALVLTGMLLYIASRYMATHEAKPGRIGDADAFVVGVFQAAAIMPGISRSGATIAGGILRGVSPRVATRFSFLLAIPVIGGAALLKAPELLAVENSSVLPYAVGMATAFTAGMVGIRALMAVVAQGRLRLFSLYCWTVAAALLVLQVR
jgi:undecaprenyl-diphosphatase